MKKFEDCSSEKYWILLCVNKKKKKLGKLGQYQQRVMINFRCMFKKKKRKKFRYMYTLCMIKSKIESYLKSSDFYTVLLYEINIICA